MGRRCAAGSVRGAVLGGPVPLSVSETDVHCEVKGAVRAELGKFKRLGEHFGALAAWSCGEIGLMTNPEIGLMTNPWSCGEIGLMTNPREPMPFPHGEPDRHRRLSLVPVGKRRWRRGEHLHEGIAIGAFRVYRRS